MDEQLIYQAIEMQKLSEETESQLSFVNEQIEELKVFKKNLEDLSKNESEEILAPLGRGVFVKSKIVDTRLFVEAGAGVVVRKTPQESSKIIEEQIQKFSQARVHLLEQLEIYRQKFGELLHEFRETKSKK